MANKIPETLKEKFKRMKIIYFSITLLALLAITTSNADEWQSKKEIKPKNNIKEVMKKAHKSGLLKKVTSGKSTKDENKELLKLYIDLSRNLPQKGKKENWFKLTGQLIAASSEVVIGEKDGILNLKSASSCKTCHSEFKP